MKSKTIWIATTNEGKIKNFKDLMNDYNVKSVKDFDDSLDILETGSTLKENALIKARTFAKLTNEIAISDDSGLFIETLDNFPGVYSARWAGEGFSDFELCIKILDKIKENKLEKIANKATMRTCVAYCDPIKGIEKTFVGTIEGLISKEPRGEIGFGYDQIFEPIGGGGKTFAELGFDFKNKNSHRKNAVKKLLSFLEEQENE
ncbi:dITP/XTP pyrophosphatase [Spiroplasma sp. TIUS-1]|uniref:RdgB/HAM1 family non-canonical purine NTP pyrophosphatase n=1 Tax=Spiroplasma sp. TIUS-1 TaxID=216963 RepID=UPI0013993B11|nr:RdgB/HAM1 family non-canonical purine NTP pyrophosphatase [Spiroplasma sp. TIUS-1]QHX35884.1 dITP/XTP pyrophosphatase [Spiroplasma sp. TIUS-1]